jgi:hypothetical protein
MCEVHRVLHNYNMGADENVCEEIAGDEILYIAILREI